MDYQDDLTQQILIKTEIIQKEFPELMKYLEEIPGNIQFKTEKNVNQKALKDYLDSLNNLIETYTKQH